MKTPLAVFLFATLTTTLVTATARAQNPTDPATKVDFKKEKIALIGKTIPVEIAENDLQRERGLMFRKSLAADTGMLFIFQDQDVRGFWMMNTLIPLSIGYFDKDRKLVKALEMEPAVMGDKNPPVYNSEKPAMYALEMPKDWFIKNKVKPGTAFQFKDRH